MRGNICLYYFIYTSRTYNVRVTVRNKFSYLNRSWIIMESVTFFHLNDLLVLFLITHDKWPST